MIAISEYDSAMVYAGRALELAKRIGYTSGLANVYFNIGNNYDNKENEGDAVDYYLKALKIYESINDLIGVAKCENYIGNVFRVQRNYTEALKYYSAALSTFKRTGDQKGLSKVYGHLGSLYCDMKDYPKALDYLYTSLNLIKQLNDTRRIPIVLNNIANVYTEQKNYQLALDTYLKTLDYFDANGIKRGSATACYNIGNVYTELKDYKSAVVWFKRSLELAHKFSIIEVLDATYESLAIIDSARGNYASAYNNYKKHILFRDSMYNQETTERLVEEQMQFAFDKKTVADSIRALEQEKIAAIKLQRQRGYTWLGLVIMLLLSAFTFNIFRSHKKLGKEKQKSDALLLNILPGEVAGEIKAFGKVKARAYENTTVLFTDFVNFTQMSERLSAEEVVFEIDRCFKAFDAIIEKHGLEKIKTIGDGYMAASGLPVEDGEHALKAVRAALEMNRYVMEHGRIAGSQKLQMRVGLHSGRVVAGIVGLRKFAYDIWGDTVNTAARMEQLGEAGEVNVSGSTYELVKSEFSGTYRGKVNAKGKGNIDMYFITGHSRQHEAALSAEIQLQS